MRLKRQLQIAAGLAAGLGLCSCEEKKTEPPPAPTVEVTQATTGDVPVVRQFIGTVDGFQNAKIQARVVGYLQTINYKEGSPVKHGDVMFEIDPRPFQAALNQAQAALAEAQAKADLARITFERQNELFKNGVISAQEFDTATQDAKADLAQAEAAAANLEAAALNLEFCTIKAPFDGIAGRSLAQIGDLVGTADNMVLTHMSQLDPIKVYFPLSEQEYLKASPMLRQMEQLPLEQRPERLELILANGDRFPAKGRFDFADLQIEVGTGTVLMAALFSNPDMVLRPGSYVQVLAPVTSLGNAVLVPDIAVSQVQTVYMLAVVGADNKVEMRTVEVGPQYENQRVITKGLSAGETVVVEGLQKVRDGMVVKTAPYQAQADASPTPSPGTTPDASPTPATTPGAAPTPSPSPAAETSPTPEASQ